VSESTVVDKTDWGGDYRTATKSAAVLEDDSEAIHQSKFKLFDADTVTVVACSLPIYFAYRYQVP
jgi:hypothetical protein